MRAVCAGLLLGLGACVSTGQLTPGRADAPAFDPLSVFAGQMRGEGRLKIVTRKAETVMVESRGRVEAGAILVDQRVMRGDRPASERRWVLRADGAGRYSGSLSDAGGPVTGQVTGNVLRLSFAMKGGLKAEQWLTLQPDGRLLNVMIIRSFGLPVARLDEVIVAYSPGAGE